MLVRPQSHGRSVCAMSIELIVRASTVSLLWGVLLVSALTTQAEPQQSNVAVSALSMISKPTFRRMPWGDPDISGNFTTKDEANTPFERPDRFAGRRLEDVSQEQLRTLVRERQEDAVAQGNITYGLWVPMHWLDHLYADNGEPWFVIDPPDGKIPLKTLEAQSREAQTALNGGRGQADSYMDRSTAERCIVSGVPVSVMQPTIYGNSFQILQTREYVAIRYETIHETRIIPLKGRSAERGHISSTLRAHFGDAIGTWDGVTLVVDTTNYTGTVTFLGSGESLHTVERFTRVASNRVKWTATIDDSTTWTRSWTFSIPLTEDDSQPIFEYACHEGNYGLRNILAGARAAEQAETVTVRELGVKCSQRTTYQHLGGAAGKCIRQPISP